MSGIHTNRGDQHTVVVNKPNRRQGVVGVLIIFDGQVEPNFASVLQGDRVAEWYTFGRSARIEDPV